jgi:hypothetical protein
MSTQTLLAPQRRGVTVAWLVVCLAVLAGAVVTAWLVQRDMGRVEVTNVVYENWNGIPVRAKLLRPVDATADNPMPGVVYTHGYQNNRETSDPYCIEMARRGFVVLCIDAIGRGNSGIPNDPDGPDFDPTYGVRTSFAYLKGLDFVDAGAVGLMGHSLGAEMVYAVALEDPTVRALVISGFAYREDATPSSPPNMLMIFGTYDEYRTRMTGTQDVEAEWMSSPQTQHAIAEPDPQPGVTYGDFRAGTARRVFMPRTIHIGESHSSAAVAEALEWMRSALQPDPRYWIDAERQLWHVKEWATLVAMLASFASLMPLGLLLLRTPFFRSLQGVPGETYACSGREFTRHVTINGVLMWLYLPLIFALFGLHVYVVPIDRAFPMMMVNGIVWWFVVTNLIGFLILRGWLKRQSKERGLTAAELGISYREDRFGLDWAQVGKAALLAAGLFAFAYLGQALLERLFIVDFRFVFPFASDLTPYRWLMFLLYLPFLALGFLLTGFFLHGQLRRARRTNWLRTWLSWSASNTAALVVPLILFMLVQYVPILLGGPIPLVGPGGVLATFVMNLFHVIGVLLMVTPLSTWFFQLTGRPYLGAFVNGMLVAWMFASSQVIAPIPV